MRSTDSVRALHWRSPGVVSDTVEGVTIAIDLDSGTYYQFSRDASCILECLPGLDPTVLDLCIEDVSVQTFLQNLVGIGLLEERPHEGEVSSCHQLSGDGLTYETFTDLAHILMLDPIHDVDPPMGWPHADAPET